MENNIIDELIKGIRPNQANFEHIAKTGKVNGTLLEDLRLLFRRYRHQIALEIWQEFLKEHREEIDEGGEPSFAMHCRIHSKKLPPIEPQAPTITTDQAIESKICNEMSELPNVTSVNGVALIAFDSVVEIIQRTFKSMGKQGEKKEGGVKKETVETKE